MRGPALHPGLETVTSGWSPGGREINRRDARAGHRVRQQPHPGLHGEPLAVLIALAAVEIGAVAALWMPRDAGRLLVVPFVPLAAGWRSWPGCSAGPSAPSASSSWRWRR